MSWDQVISQQRAKDVLRQAITQNRVAHAYLFYGPYGTGKRAAAFAFARALQCRNLTDDGCGECSDCGRINRMIHPDVRFFMPAPTEMDREEVANRMAALGRNPYDTVDFQRRPTAKLAKKAVIYDKDFILDAVRPVVTFMAFEGSYKVVVLIAPEALGERARHEILKLLEEPSPGSVFILITERPDRLMPTIQSRCQPIRFDPLSPAEIEEALVSRDGVSRDEAASTARMADGSYSTARDLLGDDQVRAFRAQMIPFLRAVYQEDKPEMIAEVMETVKSISSRTRDDIQLFLDLMIVLIRDFILIRELGPDAPVVNTDEHEALVKSMFGLKNADLGQMVNLVEEAWFLISRNVRPSLVLTSLVTGLRVSMRGEQAMPLVSPLAELVLSDID